MTEEEARDWVQARFDVPRGTMLALDSFVAMLISANQAQNLIAASSVPHIWARHIADCAQLLCHAERDRHDGLWLDMGSGPGLPGLVIALLTNRPILLVESRRLRIAFLEQAVATLGLQGRVRVAGCRVERLDPVHADVISARAFAPLDKLLELGQRFSSPDTRWLLPKGENARKELESVQRDWRTRFHVKQSVTAPDAGILVGTVAGRRE